MVGDGSVFRLEIQGKKIMPMRSRSEAEPELAPGSITALKVGVPWIASGNLDGVLTLWHRREPSARHVINTRGGAIKALAFGGGGADGAGKQLLLVLFHEGEQVTSLAEPGLLSGGSILLDLSIRYFLVRT